MMIVIIIIIIIIIINIIIFLFFKRNIHAFWKRHSLAVGWEELTRQWSTQVKARWTGKFRTRCHCLFSPPCLECTTDLPPSLYPLTDVM